MKGNNVKVSVDLVCVEFVHCKILSYLVRMVINFQEAFLMSRTTIMIFILNYEYTYFFLKFKLRKSPMG